MCLLTLLSECFTIWSSSGLEEALQSISDLAGLDYNGGLTTLIESIKYIHNLDTRTQNNHVFGGQGPICQLSVLTAGTVPGMQNIVFILFLDESRPLKESVSFISIMKCEVAKILVCVF